MPDPSVGRTCPYCRFTLKEGAATHTCPSCGAVHHEECWGDNGGCAVLGCAAAPANGPRKPPRPDQPPARPPSGGNRGRLLVVAGVLALVVAGLAFALTRGGSEDAGPPSLTRGQLARKANVICAKYAKRGTELGQPDLGDPAKARDYFTKAEGLSRQQQTELEALEPAASVKADYASFIETNDKVTTLLGDLAAAAKAEDQQKGLDLLGDLTPLSEENDAAATKLGADDCAG